MKNITIGKPYEDLNYLSLLLWNGLATGDIFLNLSQYNISENIFKECNSRLSGHFAPDSNTALPALYDLFNDKWKLVSLSLWTQWKIELDMNNYQKHQAKKDYHILLEKTNYGIEINAFYNRLSIEHAHEPRNNTPRYEETIHMHVIEQSQKWMHEVLSLPQDEILIVEKKEIEMLEYLISALPKP